MGVESESKNEESLYGVKFEESYKIESNNTHITPAKYKTIIKISGGLIKNEAQASVFLLIFSVLAIIVSLFLFFGIDGGAPNAPAEYYHPNIR